MPRKNHPRNYCKKQSYASSNDGFYLTCCLFSHIPYSCIVIHNLGWITCVTDKNANLTMTGGAITDTREELEIHIEVDGTPACEDTNQIRLIEAGM